MASYITLLRGINLGPHNKIKMSALAEMYEGLGCANVKTFIQSGNVACECPEKDEGRLEKLIHDGIKRKFGFDVPVVARTAAEMKKTVRNNPFGKKDMEKLNVAFLSAEPKSVPVKDFEKALAKGEKFRFIGRDLYFVYANGVSKSRVTNAFIEKKLGVTATTRNWNTVTKLAEPETL